MNREEMKAGYQLPDDEDDVDEEYYNENFEDEDDILDDKESATIDRALQQTHPPPRKISDQQILYHHQDFQSDPQQRGNALQLQLDQNQMEMPRQYRPPQLTHAALASHLQPNQPQQQMMPQTYPSQPNMNVHQHFTTPNILNFTQNAFYQQSPYSQQLIPHYLPQVRPGQKQLKSSHEEQSTLTGRRRRPTSAVNSNQKPSMQQQQQESSSTKNMAIMNLMQRKQGNEYFNDNFRKKIIPQNMIYGKEELYDQNLVLKINANECRDELVRVKTRLNILQQQLKAKDTMIDELYKSAYITAAGTQAKSNLKKEVLMVIKLKRKVYELKDQLSQREFELSDMKKLLKSTRMQELEVEAKGYMAECMRLRAVCEHAVKMSGEIDLEKIRHQTNEFTNQMNQKFAQQQKAIEQKESELKKAANNFSQLQLDMKNAQQKIGQCQDEILRQNGDKEELKKQLESEKRSKEEQREDFEGQLSGKDSEISRLHSHIQDLNSQIDGLNEEIEEVRKKIPKKPEEQYVREAEERNEKIEELMDELLKKDTLIDQQAVLNKQMQKKCDQQTDDIKQFVENSKMYQNQVNSLKEQLETQVEMYDKQRAESKKLQEEVKDNLSQIEGLKQKLSQMREQHEQGVQEAARLHENQTQLLQNQLAETQGHNIELRDQVEDLRRQLQGLEAEKDLLSKANLDLQSRSQAHPGEHFNTSQFTEPIVSEKSEAVVEGFARLRSLCQVRRKGHDEVENLLFENYQPAQKVTVKAVKDALQEKLRLEEEKALLFARFLVEPDEHEEIEVLMSRTTSASRVVVKIMKLMGDIEMFKARDVKYMKRTMSKIFQIENVQKAISRQIIKAEEVLREAEFKEIFEKAQLPEVTDDLETNRALASILFVEILKTNDAIFEIQKRWIIPLLQSYIKEAKESGDELNLQSALALPEEHKESLSQRDFVNIRSSQDDYAPQEHILPPRQQLRLIMEDMRKRDKEGEDENQYTSEQINGIIEQVEYLIENMANEMQNEGTTLRSEINGLVYTVEEGGKELEVVRLVDFYEYFSEKYPQIFEEDDNIFQDFMEYVFARKDQEKTIPLELLVKAFATFGLKESLPKPYKKLDYRNLTLQSQRILNRFSIFLAKNNLDIDQHLTDITFHQIVRATNKEEKVGLIRAADFFKKLYDDKIIKKNEARNNLMLYLCIDEQYPDYLMLKKLKRALNSISDSKYLQMIGGKKRGLGEVQQYKESMYREYTESRESKVTKQITQEAPVESRQGDENRISLEKESPKFDLKKESERSLKEESSRSVEKESPQGLKQDSPKSLKQMESEKSSKRSSPRNAKEEQKEEQKEQIPPPPKATTQVQGRLVQSDTDHEDENNEEEDELYGQEEEDEEEPEEITKDGFATTEGKGPQDNSSEEEGEGDQEDEDEQQENQQQQETGKSKQSEINMGAIEQSMKQGQDQQDENNNNQEVDPYNPFPNQEEDEEYYDEEGADEDEVF